MSIEKNRVGFITLGCAKNQVDSEYMLADLQASGFSLTERLDEAEVIVINTCGFILAAREESIEVILDAARYKEQGSCRVLAVVGCLAQRYETELKKELPEVDLFLGVGGSRQRMLSARLRDCLGIAKQSQAVGCPGHGVTGYSRLVDTAWQGWAYLKISEGCDNRCSYCAIPLIRGPLVSRPPGELAQEAGYLESLGVMELNLIAQDLTAYGTDRPGGDYGTLAGLLELLLTETSIPWIRLLYAHPAHLDEEVLELMAGRERVLPYLDLPVQHASNRVLGRMGRGTTKDDLSRLIGRARQVVDSLVLRTTVLVGYPGETEADFEELLEFVETARFDRLGAFAFSREEGTAAAEEPGSVTEEEAGRRVETLLELQRQISAGLNEGRIGTVMPVLVERPVDPEEAMSGQYSWVGRSAGHAPEVDGWVYLSGPGLCEPGSIVRVRIEDAGDYDLFGSLIS
ncbi:MAG: 30S ribosomal protein S12 methylthiotransferase RimO [Gemmatimonadota bacterium]|nr:30S ribosomal protein S12 methylthiotransferase RimO [Gemmatimonadota bacterium]